MRQFRAKNIFVVFVRVRTLWVRITDDRKEALLVLSLPATLRINAPIVIISYPDLHENDFEIDSSTRILKL